MTAYASWHVSGTYYEVCNCEAVCPCRRHGARNGGRSTSGICDFAISWRITNGRADAIDLANLAVVLVGSYSDDEPGSPWRVIMYVDERGDARQQQALADVFLGRAGGGTRRNFAAVIGEVYAVRPAAIKLVHTPHQECMEVTGFLSAATDRIKETDLPVSCGIPGHDRPGQEIIADHFRVEDENLKWAVNGRCGFAADFSYRSSST